MTAVVVDLTRRVALGWRSRDALLADLLIVPGIVVLVVGAVLGHWTGIAAGGGLILLGLEAHYLQWRAENDSVQDRGFEEVKEILEIYRHLPEQEFQKQAEELNRAEELLKEALTATEAMRAERIRWSQMTEGLKQAPKRTKRMLK